MKRAYVCFDRDLRWCLVSPDGEVHVPRHVTAHMRGCAALVRAGERRGYTVTDVHRAAGHYRTARQILKLSSDRTAAGVASRGDIRGTDPDRCAASGRSGVPAG